MKTVVLYFGLMLWMISGSGLLLASPGTPPNNKEIDIHHSAYKCLVDAKEYVFQNNGLIAAGFGKNKKDIIDNSKALRISILRSSQLLSQIISKLERTQTPNTRQNKDLQTIIGKYKEAQKRLNQLSIAHHDNLETINFQQAKSLHQECERELNGILSLLNQAQAKYYIFKKRQISIAHK